MSKHGAIGEISKRRRRLAGLAYCGSGGPSVLEQEPVFTGQELRAYLEVGAVDRCSECEAAGFKVCLSQQEDTASGRAWICCASSTSEPQLWIVIYGIPDFRWPRMTYGGKTTEDDSR